MYDLFFNCDNMASKPTTTAAAAAAPAQGGAQILQSMQTLTAVINELKALVVGLADTNKRMESTLANLGVTTTSIEHRVTALDVSVKAVGSGVKRPVKAATTPTESGDATAAATATATSVSGEKFASTTQVWLSSAFKVDANAVKAKYFSEAQQTSLAEKLAADAAYQKFDGDIAAAKTEVAKDKLRLSKLATEFKTLWAIAKDDTALAKKLQDDWRAAKSEFERKKQTPANKDE